MGYIECVDAAPPHSAELTRPTVSAESGEQDLGPDRIQAPELNLKEICGVEIDEFFREADAGCVDLRKDELATILLAIGVKYNYGLASGTAPARRQIADFWRALQLQDLALAHACALGRDIAWQKFMECFREPLTEAAIGITGSPWQGRELAGSLYAELFGVSETGEQRRSPLAYYSGRGSLKGFLRATLAQRNVDHHRRTSRETARDSEDVPAESLAPTPASNVLGRDRSSRYRPTASVSSS